MDYLDMIAQAIDNAAANIVVGIIVLAGFGCLIGAVLFFCLAVRGIWRWLTRATWNDVVRSAERKALR
jgi:hypothetical protein